MTHAAEPSARAGLAWMMAALLCGGIACSNRRTLDKTLPQAADVPASTDASLPTAMTAPGPVAFADASNISVEFPADFCHRAGSDIFARTQSMLRVARTYERLRTSDCRTAGLIPVLDQQKGAEWIDYLMNYSFGMAGCPLLAPILEGGILVFGPAHTQAIGLSRPQLSRDDVDLLIAHYLAPFEAALTLSEAESAAVAVHLWSTAEADIDPTATEVLSTCKRDGGP